MVVAARWTVRVLGLLSSANRSFLISAVRGVTCRLGFSSPLHRQQALPAVLRVAAHAGYCPGSQLSLEPTQAQTRADGMHWVQANNPQAMSNALWAYATLRYDPGPQLMDAATQQLMDKLDLFNPQVPPHGLLYPAAGPVQIAVLGAACIVGGGISFPCIARMHVRQGLLNSLCRGVRRRATVSACAGASLSLCVL